MQYEKTCVTVKRPVKVHKFIFLLSGKERRVLHDIFHEALMWEKTMVTMHHRTSDPTWLDSDDLLEFLSHLQDTFGKDGHQDVLKVGLKLSDQERRYMSSVVWEECSLLRNTIWRPDWESVGWVGYAEVLGFLTRFNQAIE